MTTPAIDGLLRTFRRQVLTARIVRGLAVAAVIFLVLWSGLAAEGGGRRISLLLLIAGMVAWLAFVMDALHLARQVQAGSVLLSTGQLDRAEAWLTGILQRFTFSVRAKLLAAQQFASLCFLKGANEDVVAIGRELLRRRIAGMHGMATTVRLLLTDSLLTLGRVEEAYEALRPVYDLPLPLSERMRLLPVQLRYELAADHSAASVQGLAEKVRLAELMEPPRAGLTHALLAEACRRESLAPQHAFLAERARLYTDLAPLAAKYPILRPLAEG